MQSIERDDMPQVLPAYHSLPSTPQAIRPTQHQHHVVDLTQDSPGYAYPLREISRQEFDRRPAFRPAYHDREVIDLTSPHGQYNERPMPEVIRLIPIRDDRYAPDPRAAEYDPNRPILDVRERGPYNAAPGHVQYYPVHGAPAPVQPWHGI
jgi:hypothetical protein